MARRLGIINKPRAHCFMLPWGAHLGFYCDQLPHSHTLIIRAAVLYYHQTRNNKPRTPCRNTERCVTLRWRHWSMILTRHTRMLEAWVPGISSSPSSAGGQCGHDTLRCLETDILRHFDRDGLSFSLKEVKMGRSAACWQTGPRLGRGCGSQTCVCNEYSVRGAVHCGVTGTLEIIHISVSDNTSPHVMTRPCQLSPQQRQV